MEIVKCDNCGTRVIPCADGNCPACGKRAIPVPDGFEQAPCQVAVQDELESRDELEILRREDDCRRRLGKEYRNKGRFFIALGLVICVFGNIVGSPLNLLALVLLVSLAALARKAYTNSRKLMTPNALVLLERDQRPPVLYLRSFQDDGSYSENKLLELAARISPLSSLSRRHTYEEQMAETAKCVGPVVAIGRPGEQLPELGAARLYLGDSQWKAKVRELMEKSRLVIIRMGASPGLQWEIATAAEVVARDNLVFYLEPPGTLSNELLDILGAGGPVRMSKARFIYFDSNSVPRPAQSFRRVLRQMGIYKTPLKDFVIILLLVLLTCWIAYSAFIFVRMSHQ
jgi:hypothetical protein